MIDAVAIDERTPAMTLLKMRLLSEGLRVELSSADAAAAKQPHRVRSGSCGGLDLILPDGTWVNAPIKERFATVSPLRLISGEDGPLLLAGEEVVPITLVPTPAFYAQRSSRGTPLRLIGQVCSDRLGIGLTNACAFYRSPNERCRFCSIGLNTTNERGNKDEDDMLEAVLAATDDPVAPARHVLLGGGTPNREDAGARRIASLAAAIKARRDVSIYAMLAPPRDLGQLELLVDAGIDEIGLNIEVFSERAARDFIPGKNASVSRADHWRALERCVELFGPVNTRSITVVGLEPADDTIAGVERLASLGVLPILSPLRPLDGTPLEHHPSLPAAALWELTHAAAEAAGRHGMALGPVCIACQSNTLNIPGHPRYRLY